MTDNAQPERRDNLDFLPTTNLETLASKAKIIQQVRSFFDSRDFIEVHTPVLSQDTVVDLHLDPMEVPCQWDGTSEPRYLQTSPEFLMKRILASGAKAIYQIAHAFRAEESGQLHNPEFLMLEWYRVGDGYREGIQLLEEFAVDLLPIKNVEKVSYSQAFKDFGGIQIDEVSGGELEEQASAIGLSIDRSDPDTDPGLHRRHLCDFLWSELVQPKLGIGQGTIVFDWPASESALSIVRNDNPPVAERFELFYQGLELANGYNELLDPEVLRSRNQQVNQERVQSGKNSLPPESRLLKAMEFGLPKCSGVAVGLDRLVMAILNAENLEEVIPFPWNRC